MFPYFIHSMLSENAIELQQHAAAGTRKYTTEADKFQMLT